MAGRRRRARHDGGDAPRRSCATSIRRRSGLPTDVTRSGADAGQRKRRRAGARRVCLHLPETRSRQRRHRLRAVPLPGGDRSGALRAAAGIRRRGSASGASSTASRSARNFTPFIIPVGGPLRRPGRGRVLLAGDAGGFVNGFTAEGIYYAMVIGELAARAILESAADIPVMAGDAYRRACDHEIGSRAARFGADSAISVRGSSQDCTGDCRRASCNGG